MLKKVLLGCVLSAFAVAVSAQEMVKPIHRGLVKKNNKTELMVKSSGPQKIIAKANDFSAAKLMTQTATPLGVARSMAKAESASNFWYAHNMSSDGSLFALSNNLWEQGFKNWEYSTTGSTYYNFFIMVPSSLAGAKIDSVANYFLNVDVMKNVKVWLQNIEVVNNQFSVPTSADKAEYSQDVKSSQLTGPDNRGYLRLSQIELNKKFTIGNDGCLIGFQFNAPDSIRNVISSGKDEAGGYFCIFPYQDGYEPANLYGAGIGNLTIMAHVDVTGLSSSNLSVSSVFETAVKVGTTPNITVGVTNEGFSTVNKVSYIMTVDKEVQPEKELELSDDQYASNQTIAGGSSDALYIPMPSAVTEGEHYVSVEITKVNGSANESKTTSAGAYILGIANPAVRTSVVEEATSTACGWCPRGTVGLEKVKEALGDKVITLSVHGQQTEDAVDPMQTEDYLVWQANFVSSFPTAIINRATDADPYEGFGQNRTSSLYRFGLDMAVQTIDGIMPSEGTISLVATPADMAKVNVTSNVTFNIDREVAPYTLAYVLTQDGLTGQDVEDGQNYSALWSQENYYSQQFIDYYKQYKGQDITTKYQDTDMDIYKNGAFLYTEPNGYNNVVVAAWGGTYTTQDGYNYVDAVKGLTFINKDEIEAGTTYTDKRTLDLSTKGLIQSHKNLKLAALLINTNNYEIVNAAQVALDFSAGINNVENKADNNSVVARYNANGVRMSAPMKGLNIVKMADGSVKKFMVK